MSLLFIGGCWGNWPFGFSNPGPQISMEEARQYRQAIAAYQKTAYDEAAQSFEQLWMGTRDKRLARMALYGLACSRLMAAETPEAYADAVQLWQEWVDRAPKNVDYENPVLADALIKEKMLFSNLPLTKTADTVDTAITANTVDNEATSEPMVSKWLLIQTKLELGRLRGELEAAQQRLDKKQKLIQSREKTIVELKRKIKALETIDQKIQKKKDAIPSADTP
jgi:tetratricopeptide (TPR) repeat protein